MAWSDYVPDAVAAKRAGGRRHYNFRRQLAAERRRSQVVRLWVAWGSGHGVQRRIARALGVSDATISGDFAELRRLAREASTCPLCGGRVVPWLLPGDDDDDEE